MNKSIQKIAIAFFALSSVFGLSACGNLPTAESAPNMVDYAYVPHSGDATVYTPYNLESY